MKSYTLDQFNKTFGGSATTQSPVPQKPAPNFFDFSAAGDVWTKAADDIAFGAAQSKANKITGEGSPFLGAQTTLLQGGLAPFRSLAAGVAGSEQGQAVGEKLKAGERLTALGDVITPDIAKKYIGDLALRTIEGYESKSPGEQLRIRNMLAEAEGLGGVLGLRGLKPEPKPNFADDFARQQGTIASEAAPVKPTTAVDAGGAVPVAEEAAIQSVPLREEIRALVGENALDPQVKTTAARIIDQPDDGYFLKGSSLRVNDAVKTYQKYLPMAEGAINDIKIDPPIGEVGSKMGTAFEAVIKQTRDVGEIMSSELKEWGKLRVSIEAAVVKMQEQLAESGLSYNARTRQLNQFGGSAFVEQEIDMLTEFFAKARLLGSSPSVSQLDNFIRQTRTSLKFTKGSTGVHTTTNAERIINGGLAEMVESMNPKNSGIAQLNKYWKARKTYSDLKDFTDEGARYLGKVTQSGDYARDASIAKSAVQSILNSGKKDWIIRLEELTGYNALDDSVLALQAMKDAGDFRGLSLLQAMKDQGIPLSKTGVVGAILDKTVDVGKRVIAGKPSEQTVAFLKKQQRDHQSVQKSKPLTTKYKTTTTKTKTTTAISKDSATKGKKSLDDFEKAPTLTKEDRAIETKAFERIIKDEDSLIDTYIKEISTDGKIVNTDDFRQLFKKDGYAGYNAMAVQEPSSYLSKKVYTQLLKNKEPVASFTAGGSGTGKSSAIKALPEVQKIIDDSAVVLDSNLSSLKSALKKIEEAQVAGKEVIINYVYREPVDSFENGVIDRMLNNPKEAGRLVPSDVVAGNHMDSWKVVRKLDDAGIAVNYIDNSLGFDEIKGQSKAKLSSRVDLEKKIVYTTQTDLTKQFNAVAKRLFDEGKINKLQYEGLIKKST